MTYLNFENILTMVPICHMMSLENFYWTSSPNEKENTMRTPQQVSEFLYSSR